jgi:hypothetical protein
VFKRTRWLGTGLALGVGGSIWAQRKAKEVAARYSPSGVAGVAADVARGLPSEVKAALEEGRQAMRQPAKRSSRNQ